MAQFDLIPADYTRRKALRRALAWFAGTLTAVASAIALAWLALYWLSVAQRGELARLQESGRLSAYDAAREREYNERRRALEAELAGLRRLQSRDRLRAFLQAIDAAYVEGVWFDELSFSSLEPSPSPTNGAQRAPRGTAGTIPAPGDVNGAASHAGAITGHAANHLAFAEFMSKLGGQPGIADVRLIDSRLTGHPGAVEARIALRVVDAEQGAR